MVERVPHAKQEAVRKYMNDLESSRASSRASQAIGDGEDARMADLASFSRDPSRAPSASALLGPAEATLSLDPVVMPPSPAAVAQAGSHVPTPVGGSAPASRPMTAASADGGAGDGGEGGNGGEEEVEAVAADAFEMMVSSVIS